eukprot:jgi/Picre1/30927/NNA_006286.t1
MKPSNEREGSSDMVSGFLNRLPFSVKASAAELLATAIFVYIGTGTATTFGSRIDPETGYTDESLNTTEFIQPDQDQSNLAAEIEGLGEQLTELGQTMKVTASWGITTALAFGFSITVLAYATSHISGGQLNPAVTFALALAKSIPISQAIANTVAQIVEQFWDQASFTARFLRETRIL